MSNRPSTPAAKPKRRSWHFVPFRPRQAEQIKQHIDSCVAAVWPWVESARAGERRFALNDIYAPAEAGAGFSDARAPGGPKSDDTIRCDLAAALHLASEWDGYMVARELFPLNWPVDAELVHVLHRWSGELRRADYEAYKAKQPAKKKG